MNIKKHLTLNKNVNFSALDCMFPPKPLHSAVRFTFNP